LVLAETFAGSELPQRWLILTIADYESKSKEIFDFLGINISLKPQIPTQQMKKSFTSGYRNLLLKKIGLDAT